MKIRTLNLIPKKSFEEYTTSKKIFFWMIGIGRIVVVVTELIAILAWLSRFKLDYEIATLQERIEDKQAVLKNAASFEKNIREDQEKITLIKSVKNEKLYYSRALTVFTDLIPEGVFLTNLSFRSPSIFFNAKADSATAFANLIASLLQSEHIGDVTLTGSLWNPKDRLYDFSLTVEVKETVFN